MRRILPRKSSNRIDLIERRSRFHRLPRGTGWPSHTACLSGIGAANHGRDSVIDPFYDFQREIHEFLRQEGVPLHLINVAPPPETGFGELAFPAFPLAKEWRKSPRQIAEQIASAFEKDRFEYVERVEAAGAGFLNFYLRFETFTPHALQSIKSEGALFGRPADVPQERLLVEHTSVNPNKEWHVGHLRNAVLGDTLVKLAELAGHDVEVQNYIDDTGRQAAEAIYAVDRYEEIPQPNEKYDQFVGRLYVRINAELTGEPQAGGGSQKPAEARNLEIQQGIDAVLHAMEAGSYRRSIEAIVRAQLETAWRIGAKYNLLVWESDILRAHLLTEALETLKKSSRVSLPSDGEYKGALVIALTRESAGKQSPKDQDPTLRVLVRSNGIPTYTGKDVAYMMWKFGLLKSELRECEWETNEDGTPLFTTCPDGRPFAPRRADRVVNVVAEHQALQQQTVIQALEAAGYEAEAARAVHLSYGMVREREGRISGRKGSGASADDVIAQAVAVARERLEEKRVDIPEEERAGIAEAIAVGALRYLMVQYSPIKPITFDIRDVVSFEGNTGLYLQYALVRVRAILRRAAEEGKNAGDLQPASQSQLLIHPSERALILQLSLLPRTVADALRTLGINLVAEYANGLASAFSQFYRDCPVLTAEGSLRDARLELVASTQTVLANAMDVIGIPLVERL